MLNNIYIAEYLIYGDMANNCQIGTPWAAWATLLLKREKKLRGKENQHLPPFWFRILKKSKCFVGRRRKIRNN